MHTTMLPPPFLPPSLPPTQWHLPGLLNLPCSFVRSSLQERKRERIRPPESQRYREGERETLNVFCTTFLLRKPAHAHTDITLQIAACFAATAASSAACRGVGVIFRV